MWARACVRACVRARARASVREYPIKNTSFGLVDQLIDWSKQIAYLHIGPSGYMLMVSLKLVASWYNFLNFYVANSNSRQDIIKIIVINFIVMVTSFRGGGCFQS
jgi:hypothetical protein